MIGYYNYTVILTYMSLISSVLGMFFAMGISGSVHPEYAIMCLMISGLCDMFDGKVARTKKNRSESEKQFGIQIDSLCDAVCFGVLPSVIGYSVGMKCWFDVPVLVMFPLFAVIRLAYFNVSEEERQKQTSDVRKVYEGLPVTSVALILPVVYAFHKEISPEWFPTAYGTTLLLIAIAFITPFKMKKPTMKTMLIFIVLGALELAFMMYKTKTR